MYHITTSKKNTLHSIKFTQKNKDKKHSTLISKNIFAQKLAHERTYLCTQQYTTDIQTCASAAKRTGIFFTGSDKTYTPGC